MASHKRPFLLAIKVSGTRGRTLSGFLHSIKTVERLGPFAILRKVRRAVCPTSVEMTNVVLDQWNTGIACPIVSRCTDMEVDMCKVKKRPAVDLIPTQGAV